MKKSYSKRLFKLGLIISITLFGTLIILSQIIHTQNIKKTHEYFENFNESFRGQIVKIKKWDKGKQTSTGEKYDIVYVQIEESTIKDYDMRDSTDEICFIVKDTIALFIVDSEKDVSLGKYLLFDGEVDTIYCYDLYGAFYQDITVYSDEDIIKKPYEEASKLLPKNARIISKWQPNSINRYNRKVAVGSIEDI